MPVYLQGLHQQPGPFNGFTLLRIFCQVLFPEGIRFGSRLQNPAAETGIRNKIIRLKGGVVRCHPVVARKAIYGKSSGSWFCISFF
jgi:hypothetical protein